MYLIYKNERVIGYTTSWEEADHICLKNNNLFWRFTTAQIQGLQRLTIKSLFID